ncbi:hypothetical protein GUJ93_ZPchr0002g23743 [Zizania palustris]|uniref:Peptidase S54 rhomboid domain-containing protein n=1 Tax=Zizania palustris TaxID=103762 RepID=A0A8J5S5U5_ZIZPA|nr:hypothetical protein GUJ93_ZPchr0002g23743 [Zizania palustris]
MSRFENHALIECDIQYDLNKTNAQLAHNMVQPLFFKWNGSIKHLASSLLLGSSSLPRKKRAAGAWHLNLMAGVIRWKMVCSKQHGRAPSGRLQGAGASTPRDSLSVTTPGRCRHHYYYLHIGCLGEHSRSRSFMHVVPKVHSDDVDGSCSSQVTDEHGETLSDASQRKEGSQLAVLRCYFCKLNSGTAHKPYSFDHRKDDEKAGPSSTKVEEADVPGDDYGNFKKTSDSLEVHFNRRDAGAKGYLNTAADDYTADYLIFDEKTLFLDMQTDDQTSSFCLTNLLAAINIAVLLFEIASPVRNSDIENLSLPLMYGAKINDLILSGEWWRLLTPMCLHSGLLHIALGCWVLLTFGPRVCRVYGQVTFLLVYILGGVCGNLTSYVHTSELTVCGTGPVFALIGAWLVYQSQNKDAVDKNVSETMFRQAVVATALSFLLSSFGRIDNCNTQINELMLVDCKES